MKKFAVSLIFMIFIGGSVTLFADAELDGYISVYDSQATTVSKLAALQEIISEGEPDLPAFCAYVLNKLLADYAGISGMLELGAADSIARITTERLGDAKYLEAAPDIWQTVNTFSNSQVRSAALIALGKMKAFAYLSPTIRILEDLNIHPSSEDRQNAEQLAYGAIVALENFGDSAGYVPVYFASQGWYSERIKRQARISLEKIPADTSDPLIAVIRNPGYSYNDKVDALNSIDASSAPKEKKAEAAAAGLSEGWRSSTSDIRMRANLAGLRKKAIVMIGQYGAAGGDTGVYQLLDRSYQEGYDEEEKTDAVKALSALSSAESIRLLSSYLMAMNVKLQNNTLTQADDRMVREIISALGATRKPNARVALHTVASANWPHAIKQLAEEALRNISPGGGN
jgi:HEAT repeat protein